jgi:hypothetical protein
MIESKVLNGPADGRSDEQPDQIAPARIQELQSKYDQQSAGPMKKPNQDPRRATWKERREKLRKEQRVSQVDRAQSKKLSP